MSTDTYHPARGVQFAHFDFAAPVGPKRKTMTLHGATHRSQRNVPQSAEPRRLRNLTEILDEADREPAASQHISEPQPPKWLLGNRPLVKAAALAWHRQASTSDGRRALCHSPALACGVISLHRDLRDVWPLYRSAVIEFLNCEYGVDRLVGIVEHTDETHPHIHFYAVPRPGDDFGTVHPGYAASRLARKHRAQPAFGEVPALKANSVGRAFRDAMRALLDRLHAATGVRFGLERSSVKRRRETRPVYLAQREASAIKAKATAEAMEIAAAARAKAEVVEIQLAEAKKLYAKAVERAKIVTRREAELETAPSVVDEKRRLALEAQLAAAQAQIHDLKARERFAAEEAARRNASFLIEVEDGPGINVMKMSADDIKHASRHSEQRSAMRRKPSPRGEG
jgi:hypothetical protein